MHVCSLLGIHSSWSLPAVLWYKFGWVKLWQIASDSPNSPNFSPPPFCAIRYRGQQLLMCLYAVYSHLFEKYGIHKANINQKCHHPWVILCTETGSTITGRAWLSMFIYCTQGVYWCNFYYLYRLGNWVIMLLCGNISRLKQSADLATLIKRTFCIKRT